MDVLRKLSIKQRIAIIVAAIIAGLVFLSAVSLNQLSLSLHEQQSIKVKEVVENTHGILKHFHNLEQTNALTSEKAKELAMAIIEELRYGNNEYFWINDFEPKVLMHGANKSLVGKNVANVKDSDGLYIFLEMIKVAKEKEEGYVAYKWPKADSDIPIDKLSYVKEFAPWGMIIGSGIYMDNLEVIFVQQRNVLLSYAIIIILIAVALSYLIGKSILLPAKATSDLMKDIAEGEGDLTKKLNANANDEISSLSHFFNLFTQKIRDSLKDVSSNSSQVMRQADLLSQTSVRSNKAIQLQSDTATQIAVAMEQMTTSIRGISTNADEANQAATEAINNTVNGKVIVSDAISQIDSLSSDITDVSQVISKLANETDKIGTVLDVIRGIADQTNLLALNAAIEAARAGEQGRGFAVVADEVRTLASRTSESTSQIQGMIQSLQSGAQEAVNAVNISKEASDGTVKQAAKAGESLDEIERLISIISEMSNHIASATIQQTQAAEEVNGRINDLSLMTDEAVTNTEEIANASQDLKLSSTEMSKIVQSFKLD